MRIKFGLELQYMYLKKKAVSSYDDAMSVDVIAAILSLG